MAKQYRAVGMGGAFDHLHAGHRAFLKMAAELCDTLYVGISSTELIREKGFTHLIQPWAEREAAVRAFLEPFGIQVELFELVDPYGPTLEAGVVDAVAVTEQTKRGGELINAKRQEKGLSPLPIHVCEMVKDEVGGIISSTRIRQGEIDREGHVFAKHIENVTLDEAQRQFFGQLQGEIVDVKTVKSITAGEMQEKNRLVITVGDVCTESFFEAEIPFSLGIIDGRSQRQPFSSAFTDRMKLVKTVKNVAGGISKETVDALAEEFRTLSPSKENYRIIQVEGEEDLATVAAVLLSPLKTTVYYGQPNQGVIQVTVTEEVKAKFLNQFLK